MSVEIEDFSEWLCRAKPGDMYRYWTGHLAFDRITPASAFASAVIHVIPDTIARMAMDAYEGGQFTLVQTRASPLQPGGTYDPVYHYLIVRLGGK